MRYLKKNSGPNNQNPRIFPGLFFQETGDWKTDFEKRTIYGIIANNASLCPNSGMRSRQELSMISEERVKELYHLAAFDEYENKKYYQAGEYTMWDYVGKEIVKVSFREPSHLFF